MRHVICSLLPLFFLSSIVHGQYDDYRPVQEETGIPESHRLFAYGFQAEVNQFGGNLLISNTDVSIPGLGGFGLFFKRTHNSTATWDAEFHTAFQSHDSPLGLGWTCHYGYLFIEPGEQPIWRTGSGGRVVFYPHNELDSSIPIFGDGNVSWISKSLDILYKSGNDYILMKPNGLIYTISPTTAGFIFYPVEITDSNGNTWTISYHTSSTTEYHRLDVDSLIAHHPLVQKVRDDFGREINFIYSTVNHKLRLTSIKFNNQSILSSYTYQTNGAYTFLKTHQTGAGRVTRYTTDTSGTGYGTITAIQMDTGGTQTFQYQEKEFYYQGASQSSYVYAVTQLSKEGGTWNYVYPAYSSSSSTFHVQVNGPDGFTGTYDYQTYDPNFCDSPMGSIGTLLSSTETYNNTSSTTHNVYEEHVVSNYNYIGEYCSFDTVTTPLLISKSQTIGSATRTVNYSYNFTDNFKFPLVVTEAGKTTSYTYRHIKTRSKYLLGAPVSEIEKKNSSTLNKVVWSYGGGTSSLPNSIRTYKSSSSYNSLNLSYHNSSGKKGAVSSSNWQGTGQESYNYSYGVLSSINYGVTSQNMSRTINPIGTVQSERLHGVTRNFSWDADFRLTAIAYPYGNSSIHVQYTSNTRTIEQGTKEKQETYDSWGRLTQSKELVDNNLWATTSYSYDTLGHLIEETLPTGITYTYAYDVHGRLISKTENSSHVSDDYMFTYQYNSSNGNTTKTTVKNGSQGDTFIETTDSFSRMTFGSTNGYSVTYNYSGSNLTITPQNHSQSRSITSDWLGQKTSEDHPETGTLHYSYLSNGWLDTVSLPDKTLDYTYNSAGQTLSLKVGYTVQVVNTYNSTFGFTANQTYKNVTVSQSNPDAMGRPGTLSVNIPEALNGPNVSAQGDGWPVGDQFQVAIDDQPYFQWGTIPGASYYQFEVKQQGTIIRHGQSSSQLQFSTINFSPTLRSPCLWRARGLTSHDGEVGPWSPWVSMTIYATPELNISTTELNLEFQEGELPESMPFEVWNSGDGEIPYTVTSDSSWLDVSPVSGICNNDHDIVNVGFNANTQALSPGQYTGIVEIEGYGTTLQVEVNLNILQAPEICLNPQSINQTVLSGHDADNQSFDIWNCGGQTLNYQFTESISWLTLSSTSGQSTGDHDIISISYTTSSLAEGTYSEVIHITGNGGTQDIPVVLQVVNSPQLCASPLLLEQTVALGQTPVSQTFEVWNCGSGSLNYFFWNLFPAIQLSPTGGSSSGEHDVITVNFDETQLHVGDNEMTIGVDAHEAGNLNITVLVHVYVPPELSVTPILLEPVGEAGYPVDDQIFEIWNSGGQTLNYTIQEGIPWLTINQASGASTGEHDSVVVSYNTSGLSVGTYSGDIQVNSNAGSQILTVNLTIHETAQPEVCVSTNEINFYAVAGSSTPNQSFEVWNCGAHTLHYSISDTESWLGYSPSSGQSTGEHDTIAVGCNSKYLQPGTYSAQITVQGPGPKTITVTLMISDVPRLCVTPESVQAQAPHETNAPAVTLDLWNCGDQTMTYSITEHENWFSLSEHSGTSSGEHHAIQLNFNTSSLRPGNYSGEIHVTSTGGNDIIPVTCTIELPCDTTYLYSHWRDTATILDMVGCLNSKTEKNSTRKSHGRTK